MSELDLLLQHVPGFSKEFGTIAATADGRRSALLRKRHARMKAASATDDAESAADVDAPKLKKSPEADAIRDAVHASEPTMPELVDRLAGLYAAVMHRVEKDPTALSRSVVEDTPHSWELEKENRQRRENERLLTQQVKMLETSLSDTRITLNEKEDMLRVVKKQLSETRLHLGERDHAVTSLEKEHEESKRLALLSLATELRNKYERESMSKLHEHQAELAEFQERHLAEIKELRRQLRAQTPAPQLKVEPKLENPTADLHLWRRVLDHVENLHGTLDREEAFLRR